MKELIFYKEWINERNLNYIMKESSILKRKRKYKIIKRKKYRRKRKKWSSKWKQEHELGEKKKEIIIKYKI